MRHPFSSASCHHMNITNVSIIDRYEESGPEDDGEEEDDDEEEEEDEDEEEVEGMNHPNFPCVMKRVHILDDLL